MYNSLESILDDIKRAIDAHIYYPALAVSLTLPDICVALTFDKQRCVKRLQYVEFINKYTTENGLAKNGLGLSGLKCYHLRCGVIHRGDATGNAYFDSTHVIFTVPESGFTMHAFTMNTSEKKSALMIDLIKFCTAMEEAVRTWMGEHKNHPTVIRNLPNLLSWRPSGVSPFIDGKPVVASGS